MLKTLNVVVGAVLGTTIAASGSAHARSHRHHPLAAVSHQGPVGQIRHGARGLVTAGRMGRGHVGVAIAPVVSRDARGHAEVAGAAAQTSFFAPFAAPAASPAIPVGGRGGVQTGGASYYGGGRTASGGHVGAATCAHRTLPFGTRVLVTNLSNSRQAVLIVNDRGPFVHGRIIDVSTGAAGTLGMLHSGTARVSVQVVGASG